MGVAERKQTERNARVKLILDSAAAVFREKGFRDSTIEDIAARAKIAKGTIYLYFKSKSDLYFCLVEPALESLSKRLIEIAQDKEDGPDNRMRRLGRAIYDFYERDTDEYFFLIRYNEDEYPKLLPEDRLARFKCIMRCNLEQGEIVIREGVEKGVFKNINPYAGAVIFWSVFIGMIHFQENRMKQGKKDYRKATLDYLGIFIDGLHTHELNASMSTFIV
ncbi:MAG: TetR/AcrR family transcriptional regulator [Syntrophaceae bacterium]|nr:TetR/AcrR family transcriptional regulator [Syntrophaceae bacterium]